MAFDPAGDKITDYRKMAEGAMERVVEILVLALDRQLQAHQL